MLKLKQHFLRLNCPIWAILKCQQVALLKIVKIEGFFFVSRCCNIPLKVQLSCKQAVIDK